VFQPFGGFGDDVMIVNGMVSLPRGRGIGVESMSQLFKIVLKPLSEG